METVAAVDLFPIVGGATPSSEDRIERLRSSEDVLIELPVGTVENERCPLTGIVLCALILPDSGYGLLFFDGLCFLDVDFIW